MIGRILSRYRILAKLGEGGMGEVFLAEDTELGRQVALKVLATEVAEDPERNERFRREAKAVAALNHPNIVTIHSLEESEGIRFLTMERVEGESLARLIPGDGVPLARFFDLAIPLADALAAAHAAGIVHRDLKPANIMVTRDGRPKVLDFGLAKLARAGEAPEESDLAHGPTRSLPLTGLGVVLGTVPYMSPEQVQGMPVDQRSDIFSLGIVLYEMATGRRPFHGESRVTLASSIVRDAPRPVTELRGDAPRHLARIIDHCLAKEPEDRIQSAKDLRNELRALREEWRSGSEADSGAPRPPSAPQAAAPPSRSSRRGIWLGLATGGALLALAGAWLARRGGEASGPAGAAGPRRIAVLPFENLGAPEDGYFADGMTDEVRSKLSGLAGLAVIARASADQYRQTDKRLEQIAEELDVRYLLTATVRWQKTEQASRIRVTPELVELVDRSAPTTRWQEAFDADLSDVFRVQGEIATRVAQALQVALTGEERGQLASGPTSDLAAYDAYLKGQEIEEAGLSPTNLRRSAAFYEQAVALDPGFALAWARLSDSRSNLYRLGAPSPSVAEAAREAAERALALAPGLPAGFGALGNYYWKVARDPEKAHGAFASGLRIAPQDALLLREFGRAGRRSGEELDEAVGILRRACGLDPRSWECALRLGDALLYLRRTSEARREIDRGLAFAPANLNLLHAKTLTSLQEGDLAAARAILASAHEEVEPTSLVAYFANYQDLDWVLDDEQRDLLLRLTPAAFDDDRLAWGISLAQAWSRRHEPSKVREYAEQARIAAAEQLAEAPENAQRRIFLALALAYLERKDEAVREGERGLALIPRNAYFQHQMARIHILVGDHGRALDLLEPLLSTPYYLTPGWLRVDPNFDPLRGDARFERLARGE